MEARSTLESRIKGRLDPDNPAFAWMTKHSSVMLNRLEVGKTG